LIIIGIDFSINHPGVCISYDFKSFEWLGVCNTKNTKKKSKLLEDLQLAYEGVSFLELGEKDVKGNTYSSTESKKLENMVKLSGHIKEWLIKRIDWNQPIVVAFEGFSYGSSGNSLVDIAQGTGILKKDLLDALLKGNRQGLFVFSPGELKNCLGCKGNADKLTVLNQFKADPKIQEVRETGLFKLLKDYSSDIIIKDKVDSPFMDMVDSYLPVLKVHEVLLK